MPLKKTPYKSPATRQNCHMLMSSPPAATHTHVCKCRPLPSPPLTPFAKLPRVELWPTCCPESSLHTPYRQRIFKQFFVCIQIALFAKSSKENIPPNAYAGSESRNQENREGVAAQKTVAYFCALPTFSSFFCAASRSQAIKMPRSRAQQTQKN